MNGLANYNAILHRVLYEEKVSEVIDLFEQEINVIVPIGENGACWDSMRFI
jgi:hypothetical protein